MSRVVGITVDRDGGSHQLICCQDALEKFARVTKALSALDAIRDYIEPRYYRVVGGHLPALNYCPDCGAKLHKEKKA